MIVSYPYNHTAKKLLTLPIENEAANFYMMLLDGTQVFDPAATSLDATGEVFGNGWPENGANLASIAVLTVNGNEAIIDCDDVSVAALGGAITATHAIIYVDEGGLGTTLSPLWYVDFGGQVGAPDGEPLTIAIHANGLLSGAFTA